MILEGVPWSGVYLGAHRRKSEFEQPLLLMKPAIPGREEHEPLSEQANGYHFCPFYTSSFAKPVMNGNQHLCDTMGSAVGVWMYRRCGEPAHSSHEHFAKTESDGVCHVKMTLSPPRTRGTQIAVALLLLFARMTEFPSH
jgi:hypothetical protein